MKLLRGLIIFGFLTYSLAAAAAYFGQTKMLYFPDARSLSDCTLPEGVEFWSDGEEQGILSSGSHKNLLQFFHGNAGSACNWRFLGINHLANLGYDVLVLEYPGYGGDTRNTNKKLIEASLRTLSAWVAAQEFEKIVVMGHSLGAGIASIYADEYGAAQVVLFAPFDSVYNIAKSQGLVFPRILLREDFDNVKALSDVDAPIIIVHGEDDDVIPPEHSEKLLNSLVMAGRNVKREVRAGVGHNGLFENPGFDVFLRHALLP